jgi:hypothetical protein
MKKIILLFIAAVCLINANNAQAQWQQNTGVGNINVASFAIKGTVTLAATSTGIFKSTDNGANWTNVNATNFYCYTSNSLTASGSNFLVAGYNDIGVWMSANDGTTWTEVTNGLQSTNKYMHSVFSNGATVFTGYEDQGVFKSIDNGASWADVSVALGSGARIDSWAISGSNIFAGGYGKVYLSNNGTSWTSVSTSLPTATVKSLAASGSTIFAGTDGSGLYKSINNGTSWTIVGGGMPATAVVNSIAVDATDIFAATGNGIFKSTDNGVTWTDISSGLTNLNVLALTANSTSLLAGTSGAGIWKLPLVHATGIQDYPATSPVNIFPNPATTSLSVNHNISGKLTYKIINFTGQEVQAGALNNNEKQILIPSLSEGVYILKFYDDSGSIGQQKFIKISDR